MWQMWFLIKRYGWRYFEICFANRVPTGTSKQYQRPGQRFLLIKLLICVRVFAPVYVVCDTHTHTHTLFIGHCASTKTGLNLWITLFHHGYVNRLVEWWLARDKSTLASQHREADCLVTARQPIIHKNWVPSLCMRLRTYVSDVCFANKQQFLPLPSWSLRWRVERLHVILSARIVYLQSL